MIDPEDNQDTSLIHRSTFRTCHRIQKTLPMQIDELLCREFLATPSVVITEVSYQIP